MNVTKYQWAQANSSGADNIQIKANDWSNEPGIAEKLVLIQQTAGAMHFQFSLTPTQARQMAMALIAAAEALA